MKSFRLIFVFAIWAVISINVNAQQSEVPLWLKLDSIADCSGPEQHFASVYVWATRAADAYIATLPDTPQVLMTRLQMNFAALFFEGIADSRLGEHNSVWSGYFGQAHMSPMQYKLLGTNDHINGDSWKVLASAFTREELDIINPYYHHCTVELLSVLDSLHLYAMANSRRMKTIHLLSLGSDRIIARKMLFRWRERQFHLAILHFDEPEAFANEFQQTERKRLKMQRNIIRFIR